MKKLLLFANLIALSAVMVVADALFGIWGPRGETYAVPDLVGTNEATTMKTAMAAAGADERFEITTVYRYDEQPAGTVLGQSPKAGTTRKAGRRKTPLTVTVSMGPETVTLPDLRGENARVAAAKLRDMGLVVSLVPTDRPGEPGTVAATEPGEGTAVRAGATVRVAVAGEIPRNDPAEE